MKKVIYEYEKGNGQWKYIGTTTGKEADSF